jgi:hypothetical protein
MGEIGKIDIYILKRSLFGMSSGNVTLHPFNSGAAAILKACPERAQRVEREKSLTISLP